jgi:hypothetical protein
MTTPDNSGGGGGNVFTRKVGPLPMWGWMGIALLLAVGYYLWHKNQSSSSTSSSAQTAATNNTPGGVDSSLVPQFINQTYTQTTPPPAPNVTITDSGNTTAPAPTASTTSSTSTTAMKYSWTDTGQAWSPNELASKLGISTGALVATNSLGTKALSQPTKPIPKGAKFDYTKEPKGVTTTQSTTT